MLTFVGSFAYRWQAALRGRSLERVHPRAHWRRARALSHVHAHHVQRVSVQRARHGRARGCGAAALRRALGGHPGGSKPGRVHDEWLC